MKKRIISILLVLVLIAGSVTMPSQEEYARAESDAYSVADYNTGFSLEGENDYGVKVKSFDAKASGYKKFKGKTGKNWIRIPKNATIKFQVTYPQNYTGLCIGLLGKNLQYPRGKSITVKGDGANSVGDLDQEYFSATKLTKIKNNVYKEDKNGTPFRFGDTSYYLKGKTNSHWMRVESEGNSGATPAPAGGTSAPGSTQ